VVSAESLNLALGTLWGAGCAWSIDQAAFATGKTPSEDQFEPSTWLLYELGRGQSASAYLGALTAVQSISRDVARFHATYDVWLTPTLSEPPVPLGTFRSPPDNPMEGLLHAGDFSTFTTLCNVTGQPAMSVPLYWNADGLPIGTQFAGRFGDEATLLRLAAQLESARPWAGRRPPVSA
jgi:amidase